MAAIARHNSIKEGGGSIATLNGDRINISPDNIQDWNRFLSVNQWEINEVQVKKFLHEQHGHARSRKTQS